MMPQDQLYIDKLNLLFVPKKIKCVSLSKIEFHSCLKAAYVNDIFDFYTTN